MFSKENKVKRIHVSQIICSNGKALDSRSQVGGFDSSEHQVLCPFYPGRLARNTQKMRVSQYIYVI